MLWVSDITGETPNDTESMKHDWTTKTTNKQRGVCFKSIPWKECDVYRNLLIWGVIPLPCTKIILKRTFQMHYYDKYWSIHSVSYDFGLYKHFTHASSRLNSHCQEMNNDHKRSENRLIGSVFRSSKWQKYRGSVVGISKSSRAYRYSSHLHLDKITAILRAIFLDAYFWMKGLHFD